MYLLYFSQRFIASINNLQNNRNWQTRYFLLTTYDNPDMELDFVIIIIIIDLFNVGCYL